MSETENLPIGMIAQQLHRAFEAECFARLAAAGYTGLRMRHSILLNSLAAGAQTITRLATELGMTKQAMGELVDDLEANGYLERTSDPADRRSRLINYTDKGRRALDLASHIIVDIERDYAATIGAEQYAAAKLAMAQLIDSFQRD